MKVPSQLAKLDGGLITLINLETQEEIVGRFGINGQGRNYIGVRTKKGIAHYFCLDDYDTSLEYMGTVVFIGKRSDTFQSQIRKFMNYGKRGRAIK